MLWARQLHVKVQKQLRDRRKGDGSMLTELRIKHERSMGGNCRNLRERRAGKEKSGGSDKRLGVLTTGRGNYSLGAWSQCPLEEIPVNFLCGSGGRGQISQIMPSYTEKAFYSSLFVLVFTCLFISFVLSITYYSKFHLVPMTAYSLYFIMLQPHLDKVYLRPELPKILSPGYRSHYA